MVAANAGPSLCHDLLHDLAPLRTAAHEVSSNQDLVDLLRRDVGDNGFEGGDVAVDVRDDGYLHLVNR